MNISNKLTLSRMFMTPFFVGFLLAENVTRNEALIASARWTALAIFVIASITDYYDGAIARSRNLITNFGKLFDPLADKLLTMSAFVAFVEVRGPSGFPIFPAWAIIIILTREYLVTGLRSLALTQGRVIHADSLGKAKTVSQLFGIIVILFTLCMRDTMLANHISIAPLAKTLPLVYYAILFVVTTLTALSGIVYLVHNWDIISDRES